MLRLATGLFLIVTPVLELGLLIKTGQTIGVWSTLAVVVGAALAGMAIISRQSFAVLRQTLEAMSEGRTPVARVLDSLFLLLAGVLLLIPGLITDVLALALLIPPVRRVTARWVMRQALERLDRENEVNGHTTESMAEVRTYPHASARDDSIIEGEFQRLGESPAEPQHGKEQHAR